MKQLEDRVLVLLNCSKYVLTASEIHFVIGDKLEQINEVLISLQDSDRVLLKNGFYRISENGKGSLNIET